MSAGPSAEGDPAAEIGAMAERLRELAERLRDPAVGDESAAELPDAPHVLRA